MEWNGFKLDRIEEILKWNVYKERSILILLLLGKACLIWSQKLWTDHSLSHPKCTQLPSPLKTEDTWNPLDQGAHTYIWNMDLEPQNYPTRIKQFWKEVILAASLTFQAPQGRFSLCLFQNKLAATGRSCVHVTHLDLFSSWHCWVMSTVSHPTPSLLLDKVPFWPPSKKTIFRKWVRSAALGNKDQPWPWNSLNSMNSGFRNPVRKREEFFIFQS